MDKARIVVVGGGAAGTAAALEAAKLGVSVTLVDEHPVDLVTMGMDTPYFFGPRLMPTLADRGAMLERVIGASDSLQQADEIGVDVRLGTCVWGSFVPGDNNRHWGTPCLGLADGTRSWLLEYEALILAAGARDLVLAFPGWDLPGVLGAQAATALMTRYQALTARRMVILGSGALGLLVAQQAIEHGIEVVGIVDVAEQVQGPARMWATLAARGVRFIGSHVVQAVQGDKEVRGVRVVPVDASMQPREGSVTELACDTVCMAFGLVPSVELPYLTRCRLSYRSELGGWIPERDTNFHTTVEHVYVAGDGAGVDETMMVDPTAAAAQGRIAARAAVGALSGLRATDGSVVTQDPRPASREANGTTNDGGRQAWARALVATGGLDVVVCQCEAVTRRELLEVRPPSYLAWSPPTPWSSKLPTVTLAAGSAHPDLLKRLTRAGMGHCQGRRCREQVALLLAHATGVDVAAVPLASYRPPVRPVPMKVLSPDDEPEELRQRWPLWFSPFTKVHG